MRTDDDRQERRHRSSRDGSTRHKVRRPRAIDPETGEPIRHRRRRDGSEISKVSSLDTAPEILRAGSSRSSLPYPSFSKAHSKEAVNSRESFVKVITPEHTDLGSDKQSRSAEHLPAPNCRPPSPPETEFSEKASRVSKSTVKEEARRSPAPVTPPDPPRTSPPRPPSQTSTQTPTQARPASRISVQTPSQTSTQTPTQTPTHAPLDLHPPPPPPPPPPVVPLHIPRVDYLMQNGGLQRQVPRTLLAATNPNYPNHFQSRVAIPPAAAVEKVFGPYHSLLDQYETVLSKQGSVAVATGYRSVARRLLERLEAVFARDLSCDGCLCVMCQSLDETRLGWGDVLEWASGRRELPPWPAFDFGCLKIDLAPRPRSPVQIDPDVADEFREHYLRQSKKTRVVVDQWLSSCPEAAVAPPHDVDDETLSFAILTHLERDERPIYNALMAGSSLPIESASRAPTPGTRPRADFIVKTAGAIQRLYRLPVPPRDPEAGVYLLRNPSIHLLLATIGEINNAEWEILISGRFDGFLWSGADLPLDGPISRGPTPAGGRGPTPLGRSQAVSHDEEAEIAVLAEIEREIYSGMEALEDAFEALHRKAEMVRCALRERGAGLALAAQSRQASPGVRIDTPFREEEYSESDWADDATELEPDDSASNISSARHRRPKRRTERRTPAPVEEEDEEE